MQEHHISIQKTARYFTLNKPGPHIKRVWFVLHGYSNLADTFLEQFKQLDDGQTLVVAPEGLHRFYRKGYSGEVGASWMTRVDRQHDIKDYIGFLDTLYTEVLKHCNDPKVTVLGFSQGVATASRWLGNDQSRADQFILWASVFPPDMDLEVEQSIFQDMQIILVCGDQDEFITATHLDTLKDRLKQHNIFFESHTFNGKHVIDQQTLEEITGD